MAGYCPACPTITLRTEDADGNLLAGAYPEPCCRCDGSFGGGIRAISVQVPAGSMPTNRPPVAPA